MKAPGWFKKLDKWTDEPRHSIPAVVTLGIVGIWFGTMLSLKVVVMMVALMFVGLLLIAWTEFTKN